MVSSLSPVQTPVVPYGYTYLVVLFVMLHRLFSIICSMVVLHHLFTPLLVHCVYYQVAFCTFCNNFKMKRLMNGSINVFSFSFFYLFLFFPKQINVNLVMFYYVDYRGSSEIKCPVNGAKKLMLCRI